MNARQRSRIVRAASRFANLDEDRAHDRLQDAKVGIELDIASRDGRVTLLASVRLALLMFRSVTVVLPDDEDELWNACRSLALAVRANADAVHRTKHLDLSSINPRLTIGGPNSTDYRSVRVDSEGWVVRLMAPQQPASIETAQTLPIPGDGRANPLAALAAAAIGMGEVFMRALSDERPRVSLEWSLIDYSIGSIGSNPPGPPLQGRRAIQGLQVGAGTVGGGFDLALAELEVDGELSIVDFDSFQVENFGPHPILGIGDSSQPKVEVAKAFLESSGLGGLHVLTYREPISLYGLRRGFDARAPQVIVSGVDKVQPRHQVQRWWAPVHIDMATGGATCQVLVRTNPGNGRCLLEAFQRASDEPDEEEVWADWIGVAKERLENPMSEVSDDDIDHAPGAKRERLVAAKAQGLRFCNILKAEDWGIELDPDFEAATPFIALLAGVLAASELVKSQTESRDGVFVQYNFLSHAAFFERTSAAQTCECQTIATGTRGVSC